jgi:hypothetical protein
VYHGTVNDFEVFEETKKRQRAFGFHFGSISQAEYFAGYGYDGRGHTWSGGHIKPVYLRIESPLRTPDLYVRGRDSVDELADWLLKNGFLGKVEGGRIYSARSTREAHVRAVRTMETAGYDGIVYENIHEGGTATTNEDSYIVFHADQIRSLFNRRAAA